ncbi:unnamed protein product [Protopolystoma xenopodis]|uniref:Uncharacterized protein n=1 Tax=Protopolystoma xenopodis TaxID=117903 RepID=A0A448WVQ3_9PLAT|nr:unnamed protein product [Protopolystoma xenopodis]
MQLCERLTGWTVGANAGRFMFSSGLTAGPYWLFWPPFPSCPIWSIDSPKRMVGVYVSTVFSIYVAVSRGLSRRTHRDLARAGIARAYNIGLSIQLRSCFPFFSVFFGQLCPLA